MDYVSKLERMDDHLRRHPHDYQTVIARLKVASKAHDSYMRGIANARLKRVAEIRRQLEEQEKQRNGKQEQ